MSKKEPRYPGGLGELLSADVRAKEYFMSLPDYVQGMIQQRADNVQTCAQLENYAENLLAGDK